MERGRFRLYKQQKNMTKEKHQENECCLGGYHHGADHHDHTHLHGHGHEHHFDNHHDHHHEHGSLKTQLALIVVSALLLVAAVIIEKNVNLPTWQLLLIYLIPYLLIGHDTLKEAAEGIAHGDAPIVRM